MSADISTTTSCAEITVDLRSATEDQRLDIEQRLGNTKFYIHFVAAIHFYPGHAVCKDEKFYKATWKPMNCGRNVEYTIRRNLIKFKLNFNGPGVTTQHDPVRCVTSVAKQWTCLFGTKCAFKIIVTKGDKPSHVDVKRSLADENAVRKLTVATSSRLSQGSSSSSKLSSLAGSQRTKRNRDMLDSDDGDDDDDLPQSKKCVICQDAISNVVLVPCGHMCCCSGCAKRVGNKCPLCRGAITLKQKVY